MLFIFHNGITPPVRDALLNVDIQIQGEIEPVQLYVDSPVTQTHSCDIQHSCDSSDFKDYSSSSDEELTTATEFLKKQKNKERLAVRSDLQEQKLDCFYNKKETKIEEQGYVPLEFNKEGKKGEKIDKEGCDYGWKECNVISKREKELFSDGSVSVNVMSRINCDPSDMPRIEEKGILGGISDTRDKNPSKPQSFRKGQVPNIPGSVPQGFTGGDSQLNLTLSRVSIKEECSLENNSRSTGKELVLGDARPQGAAWKYLSKDLNIRHCTRSENGATPRAGKKYKFCRKIL